MFRSEFAFGIKSEHDVAIVGLWGASVYFQGILYIVGCIFSLEVLPRCCGGEYVHHRPCLGCGSRVPCGATLCSKACLLRNKTA